MPLPVPNSDETEEEFMGRCMANETMMTDFDDQKQRTAVCYSQFSEGRRKDEPLNGKSSNAKRETKTFSFDITETKEVQIDGQNYGVVRGYASTYGNVDRGSDRVIRGAFKKSLERYRKTNRPIKMYYQHDNKEIIGGFPVDKIMDDESGLYVEGQINLDVQRGREAYALAKQGVIQDFSIGYSVSDYDIKSGVRQLKELELWEISMVGEPMNPEARILAVKSDELNPEVEEEIEQAIQAAEMEIPTLEDEEVKEEVSEFKYTYEDVKNIKDKRDFEKLLRDSGVFSKQAAIYLSSWFDVKRSDSDLEHELNEVKNLINFIKNGVQ
jgi:HK97 family phage prohead protease